MNWICKLFIITYGLQALGYDNFCHTRSNEHPVERVCRGVSPIPASKTRNIQHDKQLSCSSSSVDIKRTPQVYDQELWHNLVLQDRALGERKAYEYRRQFPDPHWDRDVGYQTYEQWTWESCELVTREHPCGAEYDEQEVEVEVPCNNPAERHRKCTAKKMQKIKKIKSCFVDVVHHEREFCSQENVKLSIDYVKPTEEEWNPASDEYLDIVPNKYDLMPGEFERLWVKLNPGFLDNPKRLRWDFNIQHNVNQYQYDTSGSALNAVCAQDSKYDLYWRIETQHRIQSRTPNALRTKKLVWNQELDDQNKMVNSYPMEILFHDEQAFAIKRFSEESHEREKLQFFKDTQIRVQRYKKRWWWYWDRLLSQTRHAGDSIEPSLNPLISKDQNERLADVWRLNILDDTASAMAPSRDYELRVSVYQKGVGIYHQACSDVEAGKPCLEHEDEVFSMPLVLPFKTPVSIDKRTIFQKLWDGWPIEPVLHYLTSFWMNGERASYLREEGYPFVDRWIEPTILWGTVLGVPIFIWFKYYTKIKPE